MTTLNTHAEAFAYDVLGPIFHRYLNRLDLYMAALDDGNTAYLFAARAGVRIQELYNIYIKARGTAPLPNQHLFWVSRVLVCKALFKRQTALVLPILERNYYGMTVGEAVAALVRYRSDILEQLDKRTPLMRAPVSEIAAVARGDEGGLAPLNAYLDECAELFDAYLDGMRPNGAGTDTRFVLIDSGWQGTTQKLLHYGYPSDDWYGLYFGRILENMFDDDVLARLVGVLFERDAYDPAQPVTSFIVHRHLIENLFETPGRSIEELVCGDGGDIGSPQAAGNLNVGMDPASYPLLAGIVRYLYANVPSETPLQTEKRYREAVAELDQMLTRPTPQQARMLAGANRSVDFGKAGDVPVLHEPDAASTPQERIARSLWEPGQIALEVDDEMTRKALQIQSLRSGAK